MVARRRGDKMVKVKVNKTMSGVPLFKWILDLKQQSSILWCFYGLAFENISFTWHHCGS